MKAGISTLFLAFLISTIGIAQMNLVPNSSFEDHDSCPYSFNQIYFAAPWFQPNKVWGSTINSSSTDYFDSCRLTPDVSVPISICGYQVAKTGNAYAGFGAYMPSGGQNHGREYLEIELNSPLIAQKKYLVQFYLSLANYCRYAVDAIGACFTTDSLLYTSADYTYIPTIPQVENTQGLLLSDTLDWMLVSDTFVANGGERYMTIGNFRTDSATTTSSFNPFATNSYSYYFIDDISVFEWKPPLHIGQVTSQPLLGKNPDTKVFNELNIIIPNLITPNSDGINDLFYITDLPPYSKLIIYDLWGRKIFTSDNYSNDWPSPNIAAGVYYYRLQISGEMDNRRGKVLVLK